MNDKNYEIYDIITGRKIDKSQIEIGKKYIIYYPNAKWKVRTVCFNEKGEISKEQFLNQTDKFTEIKNTLYQILERKGNKNIKISYETSLNLDNINIEMPIVNVSYQNINGLEINRCLSLNSLQDVYTLDNEYEKHFQFKNENIGSIKIGNNLNSTHKLNKFQNSETINKNFSNQQKDPTIFCISGKFHAKHITVSKGNMKVYLNKGEKEECFDLRTDDGVNGLSEYLKKENENALEN